MKTTEALKYGHFYHLYNRGINSCNLFNNSDNYEYFLKLYHKHTGEIAETFAWVLMSNHFHFLVKIKSLNQSGFENLTGLKPPHQYFSNLFNAYTKAFNKRFDRHGSLFERPFRRKEINSVKYLRHVILYIHHNPVHHGFCSHPSEYQWISYNTCLSLKPTKLQREEVIGWFDDEANFKYMHNQKLETEKIEEWLEI